MFREFRELVSRGNVLDLAVAVILGAAFSRIVGSLTDDVIMPVLGKVFGGLDFSSYFLTMGPVPAALQGSSDYGALKRAGVPLLGYGQFITQAVNFLIIAFIIYLLVRTVNHAVRFAKVTPVETTLAPESADVAILRRIRDELRARKA